MMRHKKHINIRAKKIFVKNKFARIFKPDKFRRKSNELSSERMVEDRKVCPHCGNTGKNKGFILIKSSWLFGQRFQCNNCQGTFKKADVEVVSRRAKKFSRERK